MTGANYYIPAYRRGHENLCPGCGRSNWLIGNVTAECGFCTTTLILEDHRSAEIKPVIFQRGKSR